MADDIQITVGVTGRKDILDLANAVTTLGKNSEKLAKQLENNRINDAAYEKGIQQQIKALVKLKVSVADAEKFIRGSATATLKSIEADKASKAAKDALTTSQKRADTAFALAIQKEKEMAAVEKELIASRVKLDAIAKQEATTLDQLKVKYQAGYAEMKLYKAEVEQLNLALKLGAVGQDEYKTKVEQLSIALAKGTGIFGAHANQAKGYMNQLGVVTQQVGYQVGDFFVQVQGGTNVFVALGQQATQLAGTFAMLATSAKMIGIFTGLGIAIPIVTSILAYMTRTTEETERAVDAFQKLRDATKELYIERMKLIDPKFDENLQGTDAKLKELTTAYEEAAKKAEELNLAQSYSGTAGTGAGVAIAALFAQYSKESADAAVKKAEAELRAYETEKALAYARDRIAASLAARAEQHLKDLEDQQAHQDEFNRKLAKAHEIYAKTRLEAAGLARETANAVNALNQMKIEFSQGGQAMMKYGSRGVADTREPIFGNGESIYPKVSTGGGGGGSIGGETQEEYIAKLIREYDTKKKSLGLTDEQVKRTEFLFSLDEKLSTMKTKRSEVEIETEKQRAVAAYDAYAAAEKQAAIMGTVTSSLENMFMSFVDGTKSVGDAFKGMLRDIILQIYQDQIAKTAATGIGNFLSGLFKSANGNVFQGGSHVSAYANGGVVGSPTYFPMSGGKTGLMGEAGPEAIMPLKRGANGKLGVQVDGNSGGNIVVNQTFNFSANGDESVKKIIAQAAPQIAQMTQQKIMDSRRRGGSMKAAFG